MSKLVFELRRKAVHTIGLIYLLGYWIVLKLFNSSRIATLFLFSILVLFITIDFFRVIKRRKIPVFHTLFRAREENSLGGQVYYILGMILALALFDFQIAFAVILMTVLGDMAAALFGIAFGKHWIKGVEDTAWEGVIAELVFDLIIGFIIIGNWVIVIPMALIATIVETIFPHVDDNLAIPVFSGFVGQMLKMIIY